MMSLFLAIILLSDVNNGIEYHPSLGNTINCNTNGILGSDDTCYINCNQDSVDVDSVYCGTAGKCIIDCNAYKCLEGAKIYSNDPSGTYLLIVNVTSKQCMMNVELYLPFEGTAIINVNNYGLLGQNDLLKNSKIFGGNAKNVSMSCIDPTGENGNPKDECTGLEIYAKDVQYLHVNIDKSEMNEGAIIECPENSNYKGIPCIINASTATTLDITISAKQGSPRNVLYYSNINIDDSSTLSCTDIYSSDVNVNNIGTFEGTECWNTMSPTNHPTNNPFVPTITSTIVPITTIYNTQLATINTVKNITVGDISTSSNNNKVLNTSDSNNISAIMVIILSIIVICMCIGLIVGYYKFKQYKKQRDSEIKNIKEKFKSRKGSKMKKNSFTDNIRSNSVLTVMTNISRAEGVGPKYIAGNKFANVENESSRDNMIGDNIITGGMNDMDERNSFIVIGDDEQETIGMKHNNNNNNNPLFGKQNSQWEKRDDFCQVLGDNVMANDIALDDIVDEMEGRNNGKVYVHKTTE
eukprot:368566_1